MPDNQSENPTTEALGAPVVGQSPATEINAKAFKAATIVATKEETYSLVPIARTITKKTSNSYGKTKFLITTEVGTKIWSDVEPQAPPAIVSYEVTDEGWLNYVGSKPTVDKDRQKDDIKTLTSYDASYGTAIAMILNRNS